MLTASPIVYFHGGPGFNSFAEESLLGPRIRDVGSLYFWNEPSRSRAEGYPFHPERAFDQMVKSARHFLRRIVEKEGPAEVVGHSFAAQTLTRIAFEEPHLFQRLTLVTPAFDVEALLQGIIRFAIGDFQGTDSEKASTLQKLLDQSQTLFDQPMRNAFELAAQDQALILNYWSNLDSMSRYLEVWQSRKLALDGESFFCVMNDLASQKQLKDANQTTDIPVTLVFGNHDRLIFSKRETACAEKLFKRLRIHEFDFSAHFPHLEEAERFVSLFPRAPRIYSRSVSLPGASVLPSTAP